MDGVESEDEAHNVDRPARQQLRKKKGNQGKALSEFEEGSTVTGTIKSITTYGAFVDIGATTDGLLHISQLATGFVSEVGDVVKDGQEVQVRIVKIDTKKGQVALSLITAEEEASSAEAAQQARQQRPRRQNNSNSNRRDDSAVLISLQEKGWDSSQMVEGTVVSTLDFGCFVRIDASTLNSEVEGTFDGLVHISALQSGRVSSVTDVVKAEDKVQVRVKSIDGTKVSLTMLSTEDEVSKREERSSGGGDNDNSFSGDYNDGLGEGAKDWKEILVKMDDDMPVFKNFAVVEDRRR
jgi:elongation factor Ts